MHELSIAMSIVETALEEAERRGGVGVLAVHLRVGALSCVLPRAMRSAWELARENTPLADARLVIEEEPVVVYCPTCRTNRPVRSIQEMCCRACGEPTPDLVSGRELEVTAMEIDQ